MFEQLVWAAINMAVEQLNKFANNYGINRKALAINFYINAKEPPNMIRCEGTAIEPGLEYIVRGWLTMGANYLLVD